MKKISMGALLWYSISILLAVVLSCGISQSAKASELEFYDILNSITDQQDGPMLAKYMEPFQAVLLLGETIQMQYLGERPADQVLYFESSDTNVATVNQDGLVSGVGKGLATISYRSKDSYYSAGLVAVFDTYPDGLLRYDIVPSRYNGSILWEPCVDWDEKNKTLGWGEKFAVTTITDSEIPKDMEEFNLVAWIRIYDEKGNMLVRDTRYFYGLCNRNSPLYFTDWDIWLKSWPVMPSYLTVDIEPMLIDWYPFAYRFVYLPGEQSNFTIKVVPPTVPHYAVNSPDLSKEYKPGDTIDVTFYSFAPELVMEPTQCYIKDADGRFDDVQGGLFDANTSEITVPITFTKDMITYDDSDFGYAFYECYVGETYVGGGSLGFAQGD